MLIPPRSDPSLVPQSVHGNYPAHIECPLCHDAGLWFWEEALDTPYELNYCLCCDKGMDKYYEEVLKPMGRTRPPLVQYTAPEDRA